MTKESSWCPRQIPKTGLGCSTQTTFLTLLMVFWQSWGSPGPLLMNKPSKSTKEKGKKAPCLPLMKEMYHSVNICEQYWPLIDSAKDVELLICSIQSSNKLLHLWDLVCFVSFNSIHTTSCRSLYSSQTACFSKCKTDLCYPVGGPMVRQWHGLLSEPGSGSGCIWCRSRPLWSANYRWGWKLSAPGDN